jgi:hypothetical protein
MWKVDLEMLLLIVSDETILTETLELEIADFSMA